MMCAESFTKTGQARQRRMKLTATRKELRKQETRRKYEQKYRVRGSCVDKCNRKCSRHFDKDQRQYLNSQYWNMDWKERQIFITTSISSSPTKRRRGSGESQRRNSFLPNDTGSRIQVCKTFFLTTLGYNAKNDGIITRNLTRTFSGTI